ncbi:hypothetical protein Goklo_006966 [Gossypium klotzschianum]|nr:hypothetical protein [Gossypium klotzschianum]
MPRCRRGYIHVVNNDFTSWQMYAIGGSGNPTINSQGNRYSAPGDPSAKEVTKRVDTDEKDWTDWNWRTDGDIMVNGAYFVPSGAGVMTQYVKASSVEPKSATLVEQLTSNAGVFGETREETGSYSYPGYTGTTNAGSGGRGGSSGNEGDFFGMIFGSGAPPLPPSRLIASIFLSFSIILFLHSTTHQGVLPLLLL